MAEKKIGALIKEARTAAKLSQEKLASLAGENLTAAIISKCERGEVDLTNAQLKKIAVACGVTQVSLLNAPKNKPEKAESPKAAKKAKKKTTAKSSTSTSTEKLTATEKKLLEAYRSATSDHKKIALKILKGECNETLTNALQASSSHSSAISEGFSNVVGDLLSNLLGGN